MPAPHDSRNFFLEGPAGRLEAILWTPSAPKRHRPPLAAVVCHPHPLFGGTMHNKVVYQVAKSLDALELPVLRFNFRGAGLSAGEHDRGVGEQGDARGSHLIGLGIPVNSSNFSFLSKCNKPKLFVHGGRDEYGGVGKVRTLVASLPGANHLVVVEGVNHFFVGKLNEVDAAITNWLNDSVLRLRH